MATTTIDLFYVQIVCPSSGHVLCPARSPWNTFEVFSVRRHTRQLLLLNFNAAGGRFSAWAWQGKFHENCPQPGKSFLVFLCCSAPLRRKRYFIEFFLAKIVGTNFSISFSILVHLPVTHSLILPLPFSPCLPVCIPLWSSCSFSLLLPVASF